jgi:cytochrome b pre-mRNA-processing protein 3
MLGALRKWFIPKPPQAVEDTYIALVSAARNQFFYAELGVPDTLDGRFGLIVLHLFLIEHRLIAKDASPQERNFAQFLSEAFFWDMDRSIRELGVADTGVSKRIKKMGKAYHGALQAYGAGIADAKLMRSALARNLYGTVENGDVTVLGRMADYMQQMHMHLAATDSSVILSGQCRWPDAAALKL